MRKVLLCVVLVVLILSLTGCPGFFGDPLRINDQWVNEENTLSFDLRDYTTARDIDSVVYQLLDENPPWIIANGSIFTFSNVGFEGSPYSVSISATNDKGETVTDTFTVFVNRYPYEPEVEFPQDGAAGVSVNPELKWDCEDPDITEEAYDDFLVFDIVVWIDDPDTGTVLVEFSSLTDSHLQLSDLEEGTYYYWQVAATDSKGASTAGEIWSFRTEAQGPQLTMLESVGEGIVDPEQGVHTYQEGEVVELEATPADGWLFEKWELDGEFLSDEESILVEMDSDKAVQAFFVAKEYVIAAAVQPEGSGLINGVAEFEEIYSHGQLVELIAQPAEGFRFVGWAGDIDGIDESKSSIAFQADKERVLTAHFELKRYTVSVSADPEEAGEVTGGGVYSHGDTVNLTAEALEGWIFVEWQIDDEVFEDNQVEFTIIDDVAATAHFREDTRPFLRVFSLPQNGVEVFINDEEFKTPVEIRVSEGSVNRIEFPTLQVLDTNERVNGADAALEFEMWSDGNKSNERTVVVTEDQSYTGVFDAEYRVESSTWPAGAADPGNTGWHQQGTTLTFEVPVETVITTGGEERTIEFRYWRINRDYNLNGQIIGNKATLDLKIDGPTFVQARYHVPCSD